MIEKPDYVREDHMADLWDVWQTELHRKVVGRTHKINKILHSGESRFQRIDVLENDWLGRMLVLYGSVMLNEREEFTYHEMLTHPALFTHPAPKEVMVVGGGDCCTLREVLRHPSVVRATQVEIDEEVVRVSNEHLGDLNQGASEDPRARMIFDDAMHFVTTADERFDVILSDTSDPIGPAEVLFQKSFHQAVHDRLNDRGVFVCQSESPFYNEDSIRKVYRSLRSVFEQVRMYVAHIPMYPSGMWSFAYCAKGPDPIDPVADLDPARVEALGLDLRYYNAELHRGAFALPTFAREMSEG